MRSLVPACRGGNLSVTTASTRRFIKRTSKQPKAMYCLKKSNPAPIPTHEQNLELFQVIEAARCRISEMKQAPGYHGSEIAILQGKAAKTREQLIVANQGLVASIAGQYVTCGMDAEDVRSSGIVGLIKAVDQFNHRRGNQFSTYATYKIRGEITRALSKYSRTIRLPEGKITELRQLESAIAQIRKELGREPASEEIESWTGLPLAKVTGLFALRQQTVSLDSPVVEDDGVTWGDRIADSSAIDPAHQFDASANLQALKLALNALIGRERAIFKLRHGLEDGRCHKLHEIGLQFGVSRERIRQILEDVEAKVRRFVQTCESHGLAEAANLTKPQAKPLSSAGKPPSHKVKKTRRSGLTIRGSGNKPNHHLWNNNGIWYSNFVIITADGKPKRIRKPLHTRVIEEARRHRDKLILLYCATTDLASAS
jgi:RNA polymerase primary sigma factor